MVSGFVARAARSCENIFNEPAGTLERLLGSLGHLWTSADPDRATVDEPWWTVPDGDERFVDLSRWERAPAGPWGAC